MKILNINSYYYSSSVHRQLQKSLEEMQLDLFTYVPVARGYIPREECRYGLEERVKRVECYNKNDRYIFHLKHFKILNNLEQSFDFNRYDLLHAHSLFSNGYIAMKIKEKYGIPYIVTVRDTDVNTFFKKLIYLRNLGNKILLEAESIVFLSKPYRDYLIKKYVKVNNQDIILKKSYVIPNGIDKFWLENKGSSKTLKNKNEIKLLHVGAISKRKNILTTIKAINILKQKGYNIRFTLVGKVVDEVVYNEIQKLDFVKYIHPKQKDELLTIYQENDIYVMPSINETFGLVYPEAMSQGLPVIYSKGQGFDGQFEDGEVGFGVDCFDADEIEDRIKRIMFNYELVSKKCLFLVDKFKWDSIALKYCDIYQKAKK
jgi:glycosyltransferase involved in cell wall biosynthesis